MQDLRFELGEPNSSVVLANHPFDRHVDRPLALAFKPIALPLELGPRRDGGRCETPTLLIVLSDVSFDEARVFQLVGHAVEHGFLDIRKIENAAVRAASAFAHGRAADTGLAGFIAIVHRHAGPATAATKQARQEVRRAAFHVRRQPRFRRLQIPHQSPRLIVDDPQVRGLGDLPFLAGIWPGDALSRVRVLDHPDLVPDDSTDIQLIEDDASAALPISVDRRGVPSRSARRRDTLAVEFACDLSRRPTSRVSREYPSNDLCFLFDNLEFSSAARDGPIAVSAPARMPSVTYDAGHPAANLFRPVFALHLPDEPTNADQNCVGNAVVHGAYLDSEKREPLVDARQILHVARETIERFDQHHFKCALACSVH